MATLSEAFAQAMRHQQAGQLALAEDLYRRILAADPRHADALHFLGILEHQKGRHQEGIDLIQRALKLQGTSAIYHKNLGTIYRVLNRLSEAEACFLRAVEIDPNFVDAHHSLGNVQSALGKVEQAKESFREVVKRCPQHAEAYFLLGMLQAGQGLLDEAIACLRQAIALKPGIPDAYNNLGVMLRKKGSREEAIACFRRALALKADFPEVLNNLGNLLRGEEGIALLHRAVTLKANYAEGWNNLGLAHRECFQLEEALACFQRAVEANPNFLEGHHNLGLALQDRGKLARAKASFLRVLELEPNHATACFNLANLVTDRSEKAAYFRKVVERQPDFAAAHFGLTHELQQTCQWEELLPLSKRSLELFEEDRPSEIAFPVAPFAFFALPTVTTAEQQLRCSQKWAEYHLGGIQAEPLHHAPRRKPRITIGYLSCDFHAHATAWLIAELIEKHDRDRFAIFGYSYGPDDGSPLRKRLTTGFDRFLDVQDRSNHETAQAIAEDGVDILVDLKGYTQGARTPILAYRPAPLQVNYLGYPGTMGTPLVDYILVDDFIAPTEQQAFYAEKLVHLPGCYQVNDGTRSIASRTPTRQEVGLPERGLVFCSFNNNYKITPALFDGWMRILQAVPGSSLWLLESNASVAFNLRREAQTRGVSGERLVFSPVVPFPDHLARHRLADLFLDTYPVNAHTTASDALWAGCPILTLAGEPFVSRVAGSLLRALGLPELIATSQADYESLAIRLANDGPLLTGLRTRLAENRLTSPLFQAERFARGLERAFTRMWDRCLEGKKPESFAVLPME